MKDLTKSKLLVVESLIVVEEKNGNYIFKKKNGAKKSK